MAKVSIIVPCWGVEKYLDQCINSLVKQTLKDIEIILVDDKSPDNTPFICDRWHEKDSRILVIHKPENEGLGLACNTGLERASGEYVAFCDSDDWVDEDMYECMFIEAERTHSDAVFTGFKYVDMDGNPYVKWDEPKYEYKVCKTIKERNSIILDMVASAPSKRSDLSLHPSAKVALYRRNVIEHNKIRFVSERKIPSEDMTFNMRVVNACNIVTILSNKFYNYRSNPASITHSVKKDAFIRLIAHYSYLKELSKTLNLGTEGIIRAQRLLIGYGRGVIAKVIKSDMCIKEKKELVSSICSNPIWEEIWSEYPIKLMPFKHKIFLYSMKFKLYYVLFILAHKMK